MANIVKHCLICEKNREDYINHFKDIFMDFYPDFLDSKVVGYYSINEKENYDFCQVHPQEKLILSPLTYQEYYTLTSMPIDLSFLHAMEELKQKDPIEFQLKMSQLSVNLSIQENIEKEYSNKPCCPKCKSTAITTGARGINWTWGLIGASKTVNRCASCGHTWKP